MLENAFEIVEPAAESPVLVEVPHAGLWLDAESAAWTTAPARSIARDADLYVDELFADAVDAGATFMYARLSRYVVDLNRAPDDYDGAAVEGAPAPRGPGRERPRGMIWRLTSEGHPVLREPLHAAELTRRVSCFHQPYHDALARRLAEKRERFGFAVLLCGHSMPTPRTRSGQPDPRMDIADLVPGTRGRTSADEVWIDLVERMGLEQGWRVQHDVPYRGGYSTSHYGRPAEDIHAIQVEIARRLYMNEETLARTAGDFSKVRAFARKLVAALVEKANKDAHDRR